MNHPWVHMCLPVLNLPSHLPHHPSGLSQSTGFERPASEIKLHWPEDITFKQINWTNKMKENLTTNEENMMNKHKRGLMNHTK